MARSLLHAFAATDLRLMRSLLADDLHASVTNREGGVDEVIGAGANVARVMAMDLPRAEF